MTSIAATISLDQRGPSAIYIISDSRITWGNKHSHWDAGRKTYASKISPDVFGFFGDAFFPSMILGQIVDQIDLGLLFVGDTSAYERHKKYISLFKSSIGRAKKTPIVNFSIIHASRDGEFMDSSFKLWKTCYNAENKTWNDEEIIINSNESALLLSGGSGKSTIEKTQNLYNSSPIKGTSRSVIMSFCDSIRSQIDPLSAPPPQLVGIWRKGSGQSFGIIYNKRRFIGGIEAQSAQDYPKIQWFNEKFERCDGKTKVVAAGAAKHLKPNFQSD